MFFSRRKKKERGGRKKKKRGPIRQLVNGFYSDFLLPISATTRHEKKGG